MRPCSARSICFAALFAALATAPRAASAGEDAAAATATAPAADQEIGASLGVELGGRVSPGGLRAAGDYLYRLSATDWFDGALAFTIGGGGAACFLDRQNNTVCDHGLVDGFSGEVDAGVRRFFRGHAGFTPYARAGLGLRLVSFSGDGVGGAAVPAWIGGGVRARVSPDLAISGGAELRAGVAFLNDHLGVQPQFSFEISAGVDFALE